MFGQVVQDEAVPSNHQQLHTQQLSVTSEKT